MIHTMQVNMPFAPQTPYKKMLLVGLGIFVVLVVLGNLLINQFGLFWKQPSNTGPIGLAAITPKCPTTDSFCNQSTPVTNTEFNVQGIGETLPAGTPILAAFDGDILAIYSVLPKQYKNDRIATIYLDNKEKKLRAVYYYKGDLPTATKAKAGDTIAKTGESMALFNKSLIFELIEGDPLAGRPLVITRDTFQK